MAVYAKASERPQSKAQHILDPQWESNPTTQTVSIDRLKPYVSKTTTIPCTTADDEAEDDDMEVIRYHPQQHMDMTPVQTPQLDQARQLEEARSRKSDEPLAVEQARRRETDKVHESERTETEARDQPSTSGTRSVRRSAPAGPEQPPHKRVARRKSRTASTSTPSATLGVALRPRTQQVQYQELDSSVSGDDESSRPKKKLKKKDSDPDFRVSSVESTDSENMLSVQQRIGSEVEANRDDDRDSLDSDEPQSHCTTT